MSAVLGTTVRVHHSPLKHEGGRPSFSNFAKLQITPCDWWRSNEVQILGLCNHMFQSDAEFDKKITFSVIRRTMTHSLVAGYGLCDIFELCSPLWRLAVEAAHFLDSFVKLI